MMKKALIYGILSSIFFSVTFVVNRSMHLEGGYWLWGAILRYVYMLPLLFIILYRQNKLQAILSEIRQNFSFWIVWSTVGFGLFYAPLSLASAYGEAWVVASTWQMTIVCGVLLTPLFGKKIPIKSLIISSVIIVGVFVMQIENMNVDNIKNLVMTVVPILIAAFAYPLGNRKTMSKCPQNIDTIQRIFAMTLCSMPFWLLCSAYATIKVGLPTTDQHILSFSVALFSGVIATFLFFKATDMTKDNPRHLAVIEATQSGEVIFSLLGGVLILGDGLPTTIGFIGIAIIIIGMIAHSVIE